MFYLPHRDRPLIEDEGFKGMSPVFRRADDEEYEAICRHLRVGYHSSYEHYTSMLVVKGDKGVSRNVLGPGIYFTGYITTNPRGVMNFLELRTEEKAAKRPSKPLYEIAMAAKKLEAIFAEYWPETHRLWYENGRMAP
jgi:thymidylate synthase (FAD)